MINFTFNWLNYTPKGAHFKNDLEYLGDDGVECDLKNTFFEYIYLEVTSKSLTRVGLDGHILKPGLTVTSAK